MSRRALLALVSATVAACTESVPVEVEIPDGHSGPLIIEWNVSGMPELPFENGRFIARIPESGYLATATVDPPGRAAVEKRRRVIVRCHVFRMSASGRVALTRGGGSGGRHGSRRSLTSNDYSLDTREDPPDPLPIANTLTTAAQWEIYVGPGDNHGYDRAAWLEERRKNAPRPHPRSELPP